LGGEIWDHRCGAEEPTYGAASEMTTPQNKIEIFGPKSDGSYWLELRQSDGQSLVVSVPASEAAVLKYFQARMPYGLMVPDVS
jgi:hypothetical protein